MNKVVFECRPVFFIPKLKVIVIGNWTLYIHILFATNVEQSSCTDLSNLHARKDNFGNQIGVNKVNEYTK